MKRFLSLVYRVTPGFVLRFGLYLSNTKFNHGAVAVLSDDAGRVLLLRHVYRKGYPWGFPSGFVNAGEDAAEGALREVREETGLTATITQVGASVLVAPRHLETVVYGCADSTAPLKLCHEIFEGRWIDPADVPKDVAAGLPQEQHAVLVSLTKTRGG